jgi:3-keto-disaccharide hydrolase
MSRLVRAFVPMLIATCVLSAPAADSTTIRLFNGKDLTNFYTFLKDAGKNSDPKKVFTVEDGLIHVSGEVFGYLGTEKDYADYRLTVEFKWGAQTYPPREKNARDSGVLLHATGPDRVWPQCIEYQMIEGGTGDIILVGGGKDKPTKATAAVEQKDKQFYFTPGAATREFNGGRVNWFGRDPAWKDVKGYRGPKDVERPVGEWNVMELTCDGASATYKLNGVQVNAATNLSLTKGRILLQSEGAEVFFRKVELRPLGR